MGAGVGGHLFSRVCVPLILYRKIDRHTLGTGKAWTALGGLAVWEETGTFGVV